MSADDAVGYGIALLLAVLAISVVVLVPLAAGRDMEGPQVSDVCDARFTDDCTCPPWQATQCGPDGTPEDYCCPDDACRCPVHCWDEDHDRPMWETYEALASEDDDE